jgi:hypothetical protein
LNLNTSGCLQSKTRDKVSLRECPANYRVFVPVGTLTAKLPVDKTKARQLRDQHIAATVEIEISRPSNKHKYSYLFYTILVYVTYTDVFKRMKFPDHFTPFKDLHVEISGS